MAKKLTGKALTEFEAKRDVWQEVLDGVREIKAGGGKRKKVEPKPAPRARSTSLRPPRVAVSLRLVRSRRSTA